MTPEIPQLSPTPLKIHHLLALQTVWTDELWDQALEYFLRIVSTQEAIWMTAILLTGDPDIDTDGGPYKIDYLREFRPYPPSAMLGAFDLIRLNRL